MHAAPEIARRQGCRVGTRQECITANPGFRTTAAATIVRPWVPGWQTDDEGSTRLIEAYIYSSCTSCRKTESVLRDSGAAYQARDYFKDRFSRDELTEVLARANLTPRDVVSKRSKVYKARGNELEALEDDELLDLMIQEPTMLRRPLVLGPTGAIVGHHQAKLEEMIAAGNEE
jgi:Spx/MgsR family transcriptional regulator